MNESYDSDKQFTVSDLLTYDLEENAQLIHTIYLGAIAEYDLELKINQISKFWEEREYKLAKHIPDSVLSTKGRTELSIFDRVIFRYVCSVLSFSLFYVVKHLN